MVLTELKVIRFNMNAELLGDRPLSCKLYKLNTPHGRSDIRLPYPVPAKHHDPQIGYDIEVELREQDPLKFAKRLKELENYEIELQYSYEDMKRFIHSGSIQIRGTFTEFKETRLNEWKQDKQYEELYEAANIQSHGRGSESFEFHATHERSPLGTDVATHDESPEIEIIDPPKTLIGYLGGKREFAVLLWVRFFNENNQDDLVRSFEIQYAGKWYKPVEHPPESVTFYNKSGQSTHTGKSIPWVSRGGSENTGSGTRSNWMITCCTTSIGTGAAVVKGKIGFWSNV